MHVKNFSRHTINSENGFFGNKPKKRIKRTNGWQKVINTPQLKGNAYTARNLEADGFNNERLDIQMKRVKKTSRPSFFYSQIAKYFETFRLFKYSERKFVPQPLKKVAKVETVDSATDILAKAITGKFFSRQEQIQLEMETLSRHFQHRRQLLEPSFTEIQVAQLLGASPQTPHDLVSSKTLLAIRDDGKLCFPSWQFDPEGPDGVIDGLPAVLKALEISDYAKLNWLTRVNPYLDSQTPIQSLKSGQKERVLAEASAVGVGQWS